MAKKPNKTTAGTNVQQVQKHNQKAAQSQTPGQQNKKYGTEFAAEANAATNAQEVKQQNEMAAQGQYETEFAEETNAQTVKKQNKKSQAKKK